MGITLVVNGIMEFTGGGAVIEGSMGSIRVLGRAGDGGWIGDRRLREADGGVNWTASEVLLFGVCFIRSFSFTSGSGFEGAFDLF